MLVSLPTNSNSLNNIEIPLEKGSCLTEISFIQTLLGINILMFFLIGLDYNRRG
jgi:hypothetical protein